MQLLNPEVSCNLAKLDFLNQFFDYRQYNYEHCVHHKRTFWAPAPSSVVSKTPYAGEPPPDHPWCLATLRRRLGGVWRHLGGFWRHLGGPWRHLGGVLGSWRRLGGVLGGLGGILEVLGGVLEAMLSQDTSKKAQDAKTFSIMSPS